MLFIRKRWISREHTSQLGSRNKTMTVIIKCLGTFEWLVALRVVICVTFVVFSFYTIIATVKAMFWWNAFTVHTSYIIFITETPDTCNTKCKKVICRCCKAVTDKIFTDCKQLGFQISVQHRGYLTFWTT